MKWQNKARIQNLIASLPIADRVYYAARRAAGTLRASHLSPLEWQQWSASIAAWISTSGKSVSGAGSWKLAPNEW